MRPESPAPASAGLSTPEDFLAYVDELASWIPVERELVPRGLRFYYLIDQAPDDALNQDAEFNAWLGALARTMGSFLDTPASAANLDSFVANPDYHAGDYDRGPSGWLTFNQFFAREVRPGKRPIASPGDDNVIVSPADAVFLGQWPIAADSTITAKGVKWSITQLLSGSPTPSHSRAARTPQLFERQRLSSVPPAGRGRGEGGAQHPRPLLARRGQKRRRRARRAHR